MNFYPIYLRLTIKSLNGSSPEQIANGSLLAARTYDSQGILSYRRYTQQDFNLKFSDISKAVENTACIWKMKM